MELLSDESFLVALGTVITAVLGILGGKKLQSANANRTNADTYTELTEIIRDTADKCTELARQVSDLLMRVGTVEAENISLKQQLADAKEKIATLVAELEHLRGLVEKEVNRVTNFAG